MSLVVAAVDVVRRLRHFPVDDTLLYNPMRIRSRVWAAPGSAGFTLYKYTLGIVWIIGVCTPGVPLVLVIGWGTVAPGLLAIAIAAIIACRCLAPLSASFERDAISFRAVIARLEMATDWQRFTLHDIVGDRLDNVEIAGELMRHYRHHILYSPSHKSLGTIQLSPREAVIFVNQPPPLNIVRKYALLHECSHIGWANYVNGNETYWTLMHGTLIASTTFGLLVFSTGSPLGDSFAIVLAVTLALALSSAIFRFGPLHAEIEADHGGLKLLSTLAMRGEAEAWQPQSPLINRKFKPADDGRFNETPWHVLARSRNRWTAGSFGRLLRWAEGPLHPDYIPAEGEMRLERDPDPWELQLIRRQMFECMQLHASNGILQPSYHYLWRQYIISFMIGWIQTVIVALLCLFAPLASNISPLAIAMLVGMHLTIFAICWGRRQVRMRRLRALIARATPAQPSAGLSAQ